MDKSELLVYLKKIDDGLVVDNLLNLEADLKLWTRVNK